MNTAMGFNDWVSVILLSFMLGSLLTYKREGADYHFFISFLAYLLMVFIFTCIVKIVTGVFESCFIINLILALATVIVCGNKGNAARFLWLSRRKEQ